jgi:hypothetical protein
MNELGRGMLAGTAATVPMSLVFAAGRAAGLMRTPPPRQITAAAEQETGVRDDFGETTLTARWLAAHLAYGAACGVLFRGVRAALPAEPATAGLAFGGIVWGVSYGLLMPALRLYPSLRHDSRSRIAVTALAHAVFGTALAQIDRRLGRS